MTTEKKCRRFYTILLTVPIVISIAMAFGFTCAEAQFQEWDYGDAPSPTYPTLWINNGARHMIVPNMSLGTLIDGELNGQPSAGADGDDLNGIDDEDGVFFASILAPDQLALVIVSVNGSGYVTAWIDFTGDGDWNDLGNK